MFVDNNRHIGYMVDDKFEDLKEGIGGKLQEFKSDIMDHVSSFAKEISDNREERVTQGHQILRNTKRIEKLEKRVFSI